MDIRSGMGRFCAAGQSRVLIGALILAALFRAVILLWPGSFATDPDSYQRVAINLAEKGVFALDGTPTAYRPPLYPLVLSGIMLATGSYWRLAVGLVHWLFGIGTILCVAYLVGVRSVQARVLAVVLVATDPLLLHHSRLIMTETQSTFLVAVTLVAFHRAANRPGMIWWLLGGLLMGLCSLTRPTFLPWPIVAVCLGMIGACLSAQARSLAGQKAQPAGGGGLKPRGMCLTQAAQVGFVLFGFVLAIIPWGVRNWLVLGRPILGTTHGGYTFYLANNPWFYDYLRRSGSQPVWDAAELNARWERVVREQAGGDELAADHLAYEMAFDTIRNQPGMFLRACLDRLWQLWRIVPHRLNENESFAHRVARYVVGVFYLVEYILIAFAIVGRIKARNTQALDYVVWVLECALVLTVVGVHTFYWTNMRMRAPLIPILAIWAAEGYDDLFSSREKNGFTRKSDSPLAENSSS